ncbi:N-lysine methyltransferase setd6 [Synchiropus splendidus]|uniref:N-lysine methyltransferase setd6 n=1 Tax=Synchiropus splendidus TaxID=270530 RepID=UPI00237E503C|nr:N-lysine methyltransferase setd6 [Synchiropus splendidus]
MCPLKGAEFTVVVAVPHPGQQAAAMSPTAEEGDGVRSSGRVFVHMAAKAKRLKLEDGPEPLRDFLRWCDTAGLLLSRKVRVSRVSTVSQYGMLAEEDIEAGEVLFSVPRSALLHQGSSRVAPLLAREEGALRSRSGWVPLLLALLHEFTCPDSFWRPYFHLWPDLSATDQPMFWSSEERERLLRGTGLVELVQTDLQHIQQEYLQVALPFMSKHPELWDPDTHTLELYTRLVAFVMAYSFQEPQQREDEDDDDDDDDDDEEDEARQLQSPPMMVPVADLLNHVADHNASLQFSPESLDMVSVRCISAGQEVFNTYGDKSNCELLLMYGFAEPFPGNKNDTAEVPVSTLYQVAVEAARCDSERHLLELKLEVLPEVLQEPVLVFTREGCATEQELRAALKVLCMSEDQFKVGRESGWDHLDDDSDALDSMEAFRGLMPEWKTLLRSAARRTLATYRGSSAACSLEQDEDLLLVQDPQALAALSRRQQVALHVRHGQKRILTRLMDLCQS